MRLTERSFRERTPHPRPEDQPAYALDPQQRFFMVYLPIAGHHPYSTSTPGPFKGRGDFSAYQNALYDGDRSLGSLLDGLRVRGLDRSTLRSNLQLAISERLDVAADVGVVRSEASFAQAGTSGVSGLFPMILWGTPLTKDLPQRGFDGCDDLSLTGLAFVRRLIGARIEARLEQTDDVGGDGRMLDQRRPHVVLGIGHADLPQEA